MIAPETQDRQLELWPALGALLLAGLLSTLVSALLLNQLWIALAVAHSGQASLLLETVVASAVTALALPHTLRAVAGFDITRGGAFVVALGGGLVSVAFDLLLTAGSTATTGVIDGGAVSILPMFLAFAVEYQLLKSFARPLPVKGRPPLAVEAELAYASASSSLPADVEHAAARVRLVVASLSQADAVDVPRRVQEGLDELQEAAAGLEPERELDAPRRLLVAGIRQLQGELVELAESAWRGDHRSAINRLRGVQTIENALSQLG
jgi:hypothetical protein